MERAKDIFPLLRRQGLDGLLLNHPSNVSYAAGFLTADSYGLLTRERTFIVTDSRYAAEFRAKAQAVEIVELKTSPFKTLASLVTKNGLRRIGFESRHLPFAECEILHNLLGNKKFIPLKETLEPLREVKTEPEIEKIRKAVAVNLKTFAFLKKILIPRMSELEAAGEIERFVRKEGGSGCAFEVIVASGPNSSYPHARASRRRMEEGEPVIIDMGVVYDGYRCDLTRTFFLGKIKNSTVRRAASVVREAQQKAIEAVRPGVPARDIDAAARSYIARQGFGENFTHSLGHGVGLDVHEAPSVNRRNRKKIREHSIFTIEPGIYFPGQFGIRMEEMVLVTHSGTEVLSGDARHQSD